MWERSVASTPLRTLSLVCVLAVAASALFWAPLLAGGSLHAYDWGSHHWNYYDWVRTSLVEYRTLPLFMNDAWITKNFLANAESPSLGPLVWLLFGLSTGAYLKLLVVLFSAAGLAGAFLLLRDLRVSPAIAALASVVWAFNGFFVSHVSVGHPWALGAELLPGLLFLFRRAVFGSFAALVAAAAVNAFTIGGGQHQPFIWQNLCLSLLALVWACQRRELAPLRTLLLFLAVSAGLGAVKLLPLLAEFSGYAPTARTVGLPPGLLLASLAGRGQGPELAVPGLEFAHGSAWWEYAFYVGPVALAWLCASAPFARGGLALAVLGACSLVLALDRPAGLDLWGLVADLPVLRTQRSPSRFLVLALFAFTVLAALGLERLWRESRARSLLAACLTLAVAVDLFGASLVWQRAAAGPALPPGDHRPHPLRVGEPGIASAELVDFAPNRLVYRVDARETGRLVFPFRLGEGTNEWRVDGLPAHTWKGKLAVDVPPGERDLVMVYRPQYFHAGAATSGATLVALGLAGAWRFKNSRP